MKKILTTTVVGDVYKKIATITVPHFVKYAERFGSDFIVLNGEDKKSWGDNAFYKYRIGELLSNWDKVAYFDIDMVIHPKAPNLWEYEHFLAPFWPFPTTSSKYRNLGVNCDNLSKSLNFKTPPKMINTSIMVFNKSHSKVFENVTNTIELRKINNLAEQDLIGIRLHNLNIESQSILDLKDGHMWQESDPDKSFYAFHATDGNCLGDAKYELCKRAIKSTNDNY